ncbi:hypothetical protein [Mesorhizobium sp.]|uniref:hypothetical protein n=1 Tax=Mesorhizobium sp. TaxID=1871066 RepID=UPI0012094167|nr:hypothetical protein [Mesorhizobium sp.]TIS95926.1 MAG: hypothetical protein E5W87_30860 [Mesorhizobium sp.]
MPASTARRAVRAAVASPLDRSLVFRKGCIARNLLVSGVTDDAGMLLGFADLPAEGFLCVAAPGARREGSFEGMLTRGGMPFCMTTKQTLAHRAQDRADRNN